jgi:serine/threonine-protein kinase
MPSPEERDPRVWQRLDALLAEALTLAPHDRERWLSGLSGDDLPLADSLREMLSHSGPTDSFLQTPVPADVLSMASESSSLDRAGTSVGPYRLLRLLGAGGMGQVWLGERVDGTIQRQVAVKLPRTAWAPGLAERLRQERDALAALEHPNIARLYDAGVTAEGRPYLAMEFVDGVRIDEYAAAHALSLRNRLELFLQVAAAVSYAHARLVVHRDLKPSNLLVNPSGGVCLLDFGAAKLLREEGLGESDLTREIGPALSPDYASPEQIRGERVTVATDVYSLGVVLYELLTGERPFRLPRESWAALVEAVKRLRLQPASARVAGDSKWARALRGDLDAVLSRALRQEPEHRYGSVQAFADDVSRYLAGRPVLAKEQGLGERAWKFVRRHTIAVVTAAAVTLLVTAAAGIALWQARSAHVQAARAERVKSFIASMLTSARPRTGVGGVVTASDLLTAATGRIEAELAGEPQIAAELGFIIGKSFDNLGEQANVEKVLRTTVPRAEAAFGPSAQLTLHAKTLLADAIVVHDVPGALALLEQVIPVARKGLPATAEVLLEALKVQSFAVAKLNRPAASYAPLREAIELGEKQFGRDDERTIDVLGLLANTYGRFADRPNQLATAADAVERARRAFGHQRPQNLLTMMERFYADALWANDRPADAVVVLRQVVADHQRLDAAETMRGRNAQQTLAIALFLSGQLDEGLALMRRMVEIEQQQNPVESDDRRGYASGLASALAAAQRLEEWAAEEERLGGIIARLGTEPRSTALTRTIRRARLAALQGRSAEAQSLARQVLDGVKSGEESWRIQAEIVAALDDRLQLRPRVALTRMERLAGEEASGALNAKARSDLAAELGRAMLEVGDPRGAEPELRRCREFFARGQVSPSIPVTPCLVGGARLALQSGRPAEAEQLLLPLAASWERVNPDGPGRGEVLYWLAHAEQRLGKSAEAQRDAGLAQALLRRSSVPALRSLLTPTPGTR